MTIMICLALKPPRMLRPVIVITMLSLLAACGTKLTQDNIDKIDSGMSRADVHSIIGKPSEVTSDDIGGLMKLTKDVWKGPPGTVTVTYANDVVMLKAQEPDAAVAHPQPSAPPR